MDGPGEDDTVTWDEGMIHGCVCDSSWKVGLGAGQTQEPEWFGPDCSMRHCPSGDDPTTTEDETDCLNVTSSSVYSGTSVRLFKHSRSLRGRPTHARIRIQSFIILLAKLD